MTSTEILLLNLNWFNTCDYLGLPQISSGLGDLIAGSQIVYAAPALTIAALRAISAANRSDGQGRLVEANGFIYRFNAGASDVDNGTSIIVPTVGTGVWYKFSTALIDYLCGTQADGASAVSVISDSPAYVTAGSKLFSWRNAGVEKASVDKDGSIACNAIIGQKDVLTTLTPTDTSTVTIVYGTGNAWVIDASALTAANAFTIALSGAPGAGYMASFTLVIKTGATVPTVTWPAGFVAQALASSVENWFTCSSINAGINYRTFAIGAF